MNKRVFILSGRQGSGKTTMSEAFTNFIGSQNCKVFKFAEVIYKLHDSCLPILKDYGIVPKDIKKEGQLLQVLGTEYGRNCKGPNVWVDVTKRIVDAYLAESSKNYAIIDDCRFPNEFDAFHPVAVMIRLRAPVEIRRSRCSSWRDTDSHISETALDDYEKSRLFDYTIDTSYGDPFKTVETILLNEGFFLEQE